MLNSKWMKRAAMLSLSLVLLFACAVTAFAAEPSKLPMTNYGEIRIVDDVGLLTGSEKDELTAYGRQIAQETGQRTVPGIPGRQHAPAPDHTSFNFVHGEFRGVPEVLKNLTVLTGNCNQHDSVFLSLQWKRPESPDSGRFR